MDCSRQEAKRKAKQFAIGGLRSVAKRKRRRSDIRVKAGRLGKQRGNTHERNTAKWLSEWWGGEFRRTPMSGGFDVSKIFDVMPMNKRAANFPCGVECKANSSIVLETLFRCNRSSSLFDDFWEQVRNATKKYKKKMHKQLIPMLVFTRPRFPTFLALPVYFPVIPKMVVVLGGDKVFVYEQKQFSRNIGRKEFYLTCKKKIARMNK